jgi:hypothetical protein
MGNEYRKVWLAFVQIEAQENYSFNDLIDSENAGTPEYVGAWANVLVKAEDINKALEIVPQGLDEKKFNVIFVDKIENVASLVEYKELDANVMQEVDWLLSTDYVFMISDKIFPYVEPVE